MPLGERARELPPEEVVARGGIHCGVATILEGGERGGKLLEGEEVAAFHQ